MKTKQNIAAMAAGFLIFSGFLSHANPIPLDRAPRFFDADGNTFIAARSDAESTVTSAPAQTENGAMSKDDSQRSFLSQGTALVGSRAAALEGREKLGGKINYSGPQGAGFGVTDSASTGGLLVLACLGLTLVSRRVKS